MTKSTKPDETLTGNVQNVTCELEKGSTPAKQDKTVEKSGGFCIYLGPSIKGHILNGTVFSANKKATFAEIGGILEKYPLVADLIVPGAMLPESLPKVKNSGNLLYVIYHQLAGKLKTE